MSSVVEGFELSLQQKELWRRGAGALRTDGVVLIEGELDRDRLQQSLGEAAERHEILRTRFPRVAGSELPLQVVADPREVSLVVKPDLDAMGVTLENALERGRDLLPVDVESGSPFQAALLEISRQRHILLLSLPSLCADAASLDRIAGEIATSYAGSAAAEEEEVTQYIDFAEWQRSLDDDPRDNHWWARATSLEAPPAPEAASRKPEFAPRSVAAALPPALVGKLAAVAAANGADLFAVIVSAFQIVLWRRDGTEMPVAAAFDGRTMEELERAVGPFVRHVPIPATIEEDASFATMVRRIGEIAASIRRSLHVRSAAEELSGQSWPVQVEMLTRPAPRAAGGVTFSLIDADSWTGRFSLRLRVIAGNDGDAALDLQYEPACYDAREMQSLAGALATLLGSAAANPAERIGELEFLGSEERAEILRASRGEAMKPLAGSVLELIESHAARFPDRLAVAGTDGTVTYAELNRRASDAAARLTLAGVRRGVYVALATESSAAAVVGIVAIWKTGAAYVPLETSHPDGRWREILDDCGIEVCIADIGNMDRVRAAGRKAVVLHDQPLLAFTGSAPSGTAYVIYTSGSTGKPKGVAVSHASLAN